MEVNYNYNNGTILKFLRKVLNEINKEYVDSGMRTAFLMKRYVEKYKNEADMGPQHVLLCMLKDIGLFYMNGEVPTDDPSLAAASSYTFLEHCSPLGVAARPLLFYKAKYIETQSNDDYDLGLLMTLLNQVVLCVFEHYNLEEIEDYLREGRKNGYYKPEHVKKVIKLLRDEDDILPKMTSESNLYVYETQKYISQAGYTDAELEGFIDTTSFAFEFHNHETLAHTITTAEIAYALALKCRLTKETADVIKIAARVHDVGKIRVPIQVLCYPGRLEGEMLEEMRRHVIYTKEIIEGSFSYKIVEIAANHHEKLDGSGYPKGLKAIDLSSADKVIAIADICSALYCRRSYKAAFDDEKIKSIILSDAQNGKLDQRIVNHLMENFDEIMAIAKEKEEEVIAKYENMKAEYEALAKSSALKHFFDIPEEIPSDVEEEVVYVDENGNVIENYNPEIENAAAETEEFLAEVAEPSIEESKEEPEEYVAPDELFDEDDLYEEAPEKIEETIEEPVEESEEDEFAAYMDNLEEKVEDESEEDEFAAYMDNLEEKPEETAEEAEEDEFAAYMDNLEEKTEEAVEESEEDEFAAYMNNLEEKPEEPEEDEFAAYMNNLEEKAKESVEDNNIDTLDDPFAEDESSEDDFQDYLNSL